MNNINKLCLIACIITLQILHYCQASQMDEHDDTSTADPTVMTMPTTSSFIPTPGLALYPQQLLYKIKTQTAKITPIQRITHTPHQIKRITQIIQLPDIMQRLGALDNYYKLLSRTPICPPLNVYSRINIFMDINDAFDILTGTHLPQLCQQFIQMQTQITDTPIILSFIRDTIDLSAIPHLAKQKQKLRTRWDKLKLGLHQNISASNAALLINLSDKDFTALKLAFAWRTKITFYESLSLYHILKIPNLAKRIHDLNTAFTQLHWLADRLTPDCISLQQYLVMTDIQSIIPTANAIAALLECRTHKIAYSPCSRIKDIDALPQMLTTPNIIPAITKIISATTILGIDKKYLRPHIIVEFLSIIDDQDFLAKIRAIHNALKQFTITAPTPLNSKSCIIANAFATPSPLAYESQRKYISHNFAHNKLKFLLNCYGIQDFAIKANALAQINIQTLSLDNFMIIISQPDLVAKLSYLRDLKFFVDPDCYPYILHEAMQGINYSQGPEILRSLRLLNCANSKISFEILKNLSHTPHLYDKTLLIKQIMTEFGLAHKTPMLISQTSLSSQRPTLYSALLSTTDIRRKATEFQQALQNLAITVTGYTIFNLIIILKMDDIQAKITHIKSILQPEPTSPPMLNPIQAPAPLMELLRLGEPLLAQLPRIKQIFTLFNVNNITIAMLCHLLKIHNHNHDIIQSMAQLKSLLYTSTHSGSHDHIVRLYTELSCITNTITAINNIIRFLAVLQISHIKLSFPQLHQLISHIRNPNHFAYAQAWLTATTIDITDMSFDMILTLAKFANAAPNYSSYFASLSPYIKHIAPTDFMFYLFISPIVSRLNITAVTAFTPMQKIILFAWAIDPFHPPYFCLLNAQRPLPEQVTFFIQILQDRQAEIIHYFQLQFLSDTATRIFLLAYNQQAESLLANIVTPEGSKTYMRKLLCCHRRSSLLAFTQQPMIPDAMMSHASQTIIDATTHTAKQIPPLRYYINPDTVLLPDQTLTLESLPLESGQPPYSIEILYQWYHQLHAQYTHAGKQAILTALRLYLFRPEGADIRTFQAKPQSIQAGFLGQEVAIGFAIINHSDLTLLNAKIQCVMKYLDDIRLGKFIIPMHHKFDIPKTWQRFFTIKQKLFQITVSHTPGSANLSCAITMHTADKQHIITKTLTINALFVYLLNFDSIVRNCSFGQTQGLLSFYKLLPTAYSLPSTHLLPLRTFTQDLQQVYHIGDGAFMHFVRDFIAGLKLIAQYFFAYATIPGSEIAVDVHYTNLIRNTIGRHLGIASDYIFDPYEPISGHAFFSPSQKSILLHLHTQRLNSEIDNLLQRICDDYNGNPDKKRAMLQDLFTITVDLPGTPRHIFLAHNPGDTTAYKVDITPAFVLDMMQRLRFILPV